MSDLFNGTMTVVAQYISCTSPQILEQRGLDIFTHRSCKGLFYMAGWLEDGNFSFTCSS
jgi:hypothetical protein